jgi:hypothetical protein
MGEKREKRISDNRTLVQFVVAVGLFGLSGSVWIFGREGDWVDPSKPMFQPGTFWGLVFAISPLVALASSLWILVIVLRLCWPPKGQH